VWVMFVMPFVDHWGHSTHLRLWAKPSRAGIAKPSDREVCIAQSRRSMAQSRVETRVNGSSWVIGRRENVGRAKNERKLCIENTDCRSRTFHFLSIFTHTHMALVPGMRAIASRCAPSLAYITHGLRVPTLGCPAMPRATQFIPAQPSTAHQTPATPARHLACAAGDDATASLDDVPFRLIIYSKEDCPLCDKLKERLNAIQERAAFVPSVLSGVPMEVRDIATNPAWEAAYAMEVPVMRVADADGSNEVRKSAFKGLNYLKINLFSFILSRSGRCRGHHHVPTPARSKNTLKST
jgi:hypothetical protein